jgi:hypothetical protein
METTEILRILVEILIAGAAWYFKDKLNKSEKARIQEGRAYELTINNLRFVNKELSEKIVKKSK